MKVILFGASGMVGQGALRECLLDPDVEAVLTVARRSGLPGAEPRDKKVRELVTDNFYDFSAVENEFKGYDACFFCLGVSSLGMSEADYRRLTYDLTVNMGRTLARLNPQMTFCYVTGSGTDSTEHGKTMWARVKGATENELLRLFPRGVMFRPGMMRATAGQRNLKGWYHALAWIYPVGRALWPAAFCTLQEVGQAMINAAVVGSPKRVLEVRDIVALAATPR